MPIYYLDTSALMKRYWTEIGSDVVAELFEGLDDSDALITSQLTVLEMNSALARLLESRQMAHREYQGILERLTQDIDYYGFTVMSVPDELFSEAIGVVREYSLRALDALHFASAIASNGLSSGQELYMVSADRKIVEACNRYGMLILDPIADDALARLRTLRRIG